MKKLIFIIMLSASLVAEASLEERFEEAIRTSQAPLVHQLLRNLDQDAMPKAQKKSLVADLSQLADSIALAKNSRLGFFKNIKDVSSGIIGSLIGLQYSLQSGHQCYRFYKNCKTKYDDGTPMYTWAQVLILRRDALLSAGGLKAAVLCGVGAYLGYKGFTCSAQKSEVVQAQHIVKALDDKKEEYGI